MMKEEDDYQDKEVNEVQKIYKFQSEDKESIIISQSNGIITEHQYYEAFETIKKMKMIKLKQKMNLNIYFDFLSEISNQINNKSANLKMCFLLKDEQINQGFFSQLIYQSVFQSGYQLNEKRIEQALIEICSKIELICDTIYKEGDSNLKKYIDDLFDEYFELLS